MKPEINPRCLREVEKALERYIEEVESVGLTRSTARTYGGHANNFVRWMRGEFKPEGTLHA